MKTLMILAVTEMVNTLAQLYLLHVLFSFAQCLYINDCITDINNYAIPPTTKMAARNVKDLLSLQSRQQNIRNICILAHVDHGKWHVCPRFQHARVSSVAMVWPLNRVASRLAMS